MVFAPVQSTTFHELKFKTLNIWKFVFNQKEN